MEKLRDAHVHRSERGAGGSFSRSSKYDWFRNFDPVSTEVTFWGEDFNIQELVNEVRRLFPKLESVCTSHD